MLPYLSFVRLVCVSIRRGGVMDVLLVMVLVLVVAVLVLGLRGVPAVVPGLLRDLLLLQQLRLHNLRVHDSNSEYHKSAETRQMCRLYLHHLHIIIQFVRINEHCIYMFRKLKHQS